MRQRVCATCDAHNRRRVVVAGNAPGRRPTYHPSTLLETCVYGYTGFRNDRGQAIVVPSASMTMTTFRLFEQARFLTSSFRRVLPRRVQSRGACLVADAAAVALELVVA